MKKKPLEELIAKMEGNPDIHLEVTDADSDKKIETHLNRDKARFRSGSVSDWFADLAEKGTGDIIVSYRTKTSSGWNHRFGPWSYSIGSKTAPETNGGNRESIPARPASVSAFPSGGLAGPAQGLGFEATANLMGKSMMLELREREIQKLEAKLEKLERENDELKDVDRAHAHKAKTAESQASMVTAFAPLLSGLSEAFIKKGPEGLAAPGDSLSATKNAVFSLLKDPRVNDGIAEYAYHLITLALNGPQKFIDQYVALVTEHSNT